MDPKKPDPLAALRRSLTGKLNEASAKVAESHGLPPPEAGATGGELITQGLIRGLQAALEPQPGPPEPAPAPAAPAFSREAVREARALTAEEEAAESKRRMAFIVAYLKNPDGHAYFADKALLYKIMTEERGYQHAQLDAAERALADLPPTPQAMGLTDDEVAADPALVAQEARRGNLARQVAQLRGAQTQLYRLLAQITGVKATAEGEAFRAGSGPLPALAEDASVEDSFGAAGELLAQLKRQAPPGA